MIICVQRVKSASVSVNSEVKGAIEAGLFILIGVEEADSSKDKKDIEKAALKVCNLRIFSDESDKMSLSVKDIDGEILAISQFTLAGDTSKGNRPDFAGAAKADIAEGIYNDFVNHIRHEIGANKVSTGVFGAHMEISSIADGPVTIIIKR